MYPTSSHPIIMYYWWSCFMYSATIGPMYMYMPCHTIYSTSGPLPLIEVLEVLNYIWFYILEHSQLWIPSGYKVVLYKYSFNIPNYWALYCSTQLMVQFTRCCLFLKVLSKGSVQLVGAAGHLGRKMLD